MVNTKISLQDQDFIKEEPISLFSPSNPTPIETIFLSNIDQAVTFPVETVFFYEVPPNMAPSSTLDVAERVKKAVENVLLIPYYFMAGRLNFSDETERVELVCNNAGVLFVRARSRYSLQDLADLAQPNLSFGHFIHRPGIDKSLAETAIFTIQVTRFKCGGFALGFLTNHAILDGKSASQMFHNLASICRGEGLKTTLIINNRACIKARDPPQILFPHKEYVKLAKTQSRISCFTTQNRTSPSPLVFNADKYTHRLFHFTPQMIQELKQRAMIKCSTFEAMLAHIWRSRTRATLDHHGDHHDGHDQESTVLFAVDIRDKMTPAIPDSFAGNAVITGFATCGARELIERPLSFVVEMIKKGRERVTSEYIRSVIDWLEVYRGIPATSSGGAFYVSAWWKLRFFEVDFGFGRAKHAGPVVSGNDEFVLLLDGGEYGGGINVWMGLEKGVMERFLDCVFDV